MTDTIADPRIEAYVRKVRLGLSGLDETTRRDIALELEQHIADRIEAGAALDAVLQSLGDPRDYAAELYQAHAVDAALNTGRSTDLAAALARAAPSNIVAFTAGMVVLFSWIGAGLLAAVAIMKLVDPVHVGVWTNAEGVLFIGGIDDPGRAREILGVMIFPLAFAALAIAWLMTRLLGAWALRRLRRT